MTAKLRLSALSSTENTNNPADLTERLSEQGDVMQTSLVVPEIGAVDDPIHVSCWFVDAGDSVEEGDRTVELLIRGITFDVAAPAAGILSRIEKPPDSIVSSGDILGWLEVARPEQRT